MGKLVFLIGIFIISIMLSFYFSREGFADAIALFNSNGQQVDSSGNIIVPVIATKHPLTVEPTLPINPSIQPPFAMDPSHLMNTTLPKSGPSPISAMTLTVFDYDQTNPQLTKFYKAAQPPPPAPPTQFNQFFPQVVPKYL